LSEASLLAISQKRLLFVRFSSVTPGRKDDHLAFFAAKKAVISLISTDGEF